ncbi:hypothetical protein BUL40_01445 [Croceivirga radicis]|uniref:EpsG family protein n=1 Tax=Croceivirga radicis TaxID=1929488 RepID=A0A1V6LVT9_9FLAO|nr:EpsG family protein [Croceivirga radicis]OQD44249.1 hypothetical protein BUL40_01445 [Croceivirga radicis]
MTQYVILYCYALYASLIEVFLSKKMRLSAILLFIGAVMVLGYRGIDGVDTPNYISFFSDIGTKNALDYNMDTGFYMLSSFIKWIKGDIVFYFICLAIISVGLKIWVMKKLSPAPIFGIFILLGTYFMSLEANQVRQALALGVVLMSLLFVLKRKRIYFFLLVLLAASFHISALVFIPVWWLYELRFSAKTLLILVSISFLFVFISLVDTFQYGVKYTVFWGSFIFYKLENYASKMEKVGFSPIQLWYIFTCFLFVFQKKRINQPSYNFLLNIFVLGVVMNFFLNSFSYMIRITYYFLAVEGILFSMVILKSKKIINKLFLFTGVAALIFFKSYKYYLSNLEFFQ